VASGGVGILSNPLIIFHELPVSVLLVFIILLVSELNACFYPSIPGGRTSTGDSRPGGKRMDSLPIILVYYRRSLFSIWEALKQAFNHRANGERREMNKNLLALKKAFNRGENGDRRELRESRS
jgi:hypothetical protein